MKLRRWLGIFFSLSIYILLLSISASNKEETPFASGICKYVSIKWKGVISKCDAAAIPTVWLKIKLTITDLIKVDLPAALGPVIKMCFLSISKLLSRVPFVK